MLKVIFNCDVADAQDQRRLRQLHGFVGARCEGLSIAGFMVATRTGFYGCFEGQDKDVLSVVEALVHQVDVTGVRVVSEAPIRGPVWRGWLGRVRTPADLERMTGPVPGELAELAAFPVDATQVGDMRPEV